MTSKSRLVLVSRNQLDALTVMAERVMTSPTISEQWLALNKTSEAPRLLTDSDWPLAFFTWLSEKVYGGASEAIK
jgi:hypothetical protein